jgi:hypothetical protein
LCDIYPLEFCVEHGVIDALLLMSTFDIIDVMISLDKISRGLANEYQRSEEMA